MKDDEKEKYLDKKRLGNHLQRLRKKAGYSNYEAFAYDKGIPRAQYGRYETGASDIRFSSLMKIIRAFDMSPEEFFEDF